MPTHTLFPPIPVPEKYAGDPEQCKGFLLQCSLFFTSYPGMLEMQKATYFMEILTGNALTRVTTLWEQGGEPISYYEQFTGLFRSVFNHTPYNNETVVELLPISQGSQCVAEYALEFWTIAARTVWNEHTLKTVFLNGLTRK